MTIDTDDTNLDPSNAGTDTSASAPADDQAVITQDDGSLQSGQDQPSLDDQAVAAFMKGVQEATPPPKPTHDEAAAPAAAPAPAAAAPAPAPASATAAAKPGEKPEAGAAAAAPPSAKDEAVETEISELKLKDKAAARFRELSSQVKEAAPYVETLRTVGIDSAEKLNTILTDAARGLEFEEAIHRVQATPEQFSSAMQIIGGMNSGDPVLLNAVFDALSQELATLGQRLGREIAGGPDPLANHPDLMQAVNEDMTMTRAHALEVAKARALERNQIDQRNRQAQAVQQEQHAQQEMTRAQQRALSDIDEFSNEMEKADPHFAHKLGLLTPMLDTIMRNAPPSRWALEVQKAYRQLPAPAAAPAAVAPAQRPRMANVPTRGGATVAATAGAGGDTMRSAPKSDFEAFMQGVRDATPGAR